MRVPESELAEIDRIAKKFSVDRPLMIKRFISEGLRGIQAYEQTGKPFNWPRDGQIRVEVVLEPDSP